MRTFLKSSLVAAAAIVACGLATTTASAAAPVGGDDGLGGSVIGSGNSYDYDVNIGNISLGSLLGLAS
ncbi:hypothetical protein [Streptomyces sp. NBC_00158]|uniref:hypothetical protein n=1 Tax=Streptomyces sp. NBC_00158 TaxID=2903627 RepID=UPI00324AFC77